MKTLPLFLLVLLVGAATGAGAVYWYLLHGMDHGRAEAADGDNDRDILYYRNPMDSSITSPEPRQDHMGMDYIPVYADNGEEQEPGTVRIRTGVLQNMNVRTAPAERGSLRRRVEAFGLVDYDEAGIHHAHLRTEGWIEDLRVRTTGERVGEGQILFRLYSPTLVNAQEELLQAARRGGGLDSARERLHALGMSRAEIAEVERDGRARQLITVRAMHDGVVKELHVREGMFARPEDMVMTIADLSRVWVLADLFESQADGITVGAEAQVLLPFRPGESLTATVDYLYPALASPSRTVRARLVLDNPDGRLRPGMYARVRIEAEAIRDVLHVPAEAVIRTGRQSRVIVDRGEGRFQAREVRVGRGNGERLEIRAGLEAGDRVVTSGQFLIDSESSVVAELDRMDGRDGEDHPEIMASGEVDAVDAEAGTITLSHAPIPELDWPAMTMEFELAEALDVAGIDAGMQVEFRMVQPQAGVYRVTGIDPVDGKVPGNWVDGEIEAVDPEAREILLSHGPIPNLGMPAMRMRFPVADGVDLAGLEDDMTVRFQARGVNGGSEVFAIEPRDEAGNGGDGND